MYGRNENCAHMNLLIIINIINPSIAKNFFGIIDKHRISQNLYQV